MKNTAIFKIALLLLALCLVVGSVIGVHRSLSALGQPGNLQARPSTEAQENPELPPPETEIVIVDDKPVVSFIYPFTGPTGQHAHEELNKLSMDLMIALLMRSDFLDYHSVRNDPELYEHYLRSDPLLTAILQRADGPAALMDYYDQHKGENFKETAALESLFLSATFLEAIDPETYDRLFPE